MTTELETAFTSKMEINPDLQKERDTASFATIDMTNLLDDGPEKTTKRRNICHILYKNPVFNNEVKYYQGLSDRYENALHKGTELMSMAMKHGWGQEEFAIAGRNLGFDIAFGVHLVMFLPVIQSLGTDEQIAQWIPPSLSLDVIGTYAQTELGHGTNLRALETTAKYDNTTQEFILDTPLPTGMKWWPGGLGKSTNTAVVLAQLYVKNVSCGMQAFIVPLRNRETHMPLPGVEVGDIGPRYGIFVTDNGYLILKNVRIPRENMLSKYSQVTPDGRFLKKGSDKVNYSTMMMVRTNIVHYCYSVLSQGCTIATRYSAVRRQSELKPGDPEPQILDYQTQQMKLFPHIALSYATYFAQRYMLRKYNQVQNTEIKAGNYRTVPELHSQSAGLKAYCSDRLTEAMELLRRSCGGHGYMMASGLCDKYLDSVGSVTYEGDNTVLYLQVARFLVKNFANVMSGEKVSGSVDYLNSVPDGCQIVNEEDCLDFDQLTNAFMRRSYYLIAQISKRLQSHIEGGTPHYVAWNENSVNLVRAAKAHCDGFVAMNFIDNVKLLDVKPELKRVLTILCQFHALQRIIESCGEFLESGALTPVQLELIRSQHLQLLRLIRPEAVALVDAFDWDDGTLASALGRFDGNVYQSLFEMAKKGPMNSSEVRPGFYKYIKPFREKAKL